MDPASSKLLLWLLSLTRERESSSSKHPRVTQQNSNELIVNSEINNKNGYCNFFF